MLQLLVCSFVGDEVVDHVKHLLQADPVLEFKAQARIDAYQRMESELKDLLRTAPDERVKVRWYRILAA